MGRCRDFSSTRAWRCSLVVLCLLVAASLFNGRPDAQTASTLGRANTWVARSSSGLTLAGTWTATEDAKTGAVTGTWTLIDAKGNVRSRGGWSAAKSPSGWNGRWRAMAVERSGEYSGTWTANVSLQPTAKLTVLFVKTVEAAVSGTWQAGGQSGAWTIQAFK